MTIDENSMSRTPRRAETLHSAEEICRAAGARLTPQRRMVLKAIWESRRPLTAYDILDRVRFEDAGAAPVVVYRGLNFLMKLGLVHRIDSEKAFVACAMLGHAHPCHILVCRRCGTTLEAEDEAVAEAARNLSNRFDFVLDGSVVELIGVCETCRRHDGDDT